MTSQVDMLKKIETQDGFIAALDQSGGSTPKALLAYGVNDSEYSGDEEMYAKVHEMRTRIVSSEAFTGKRVLGAILFENTLERAIEGQSTAHYLWKEKQIIPFLKVDKGLADDESGVQLMKPIPGLRDLLAKANLNGVFGTKMRSLIKMAHPKGIRNVVDQQFDFAKVILDSDLVPIIEPEVDIHSCEKGDAEVLLKRELIKQLDRLPAGSRVMLKLTLPETINFYQDCVNHPNVLKVVALSGGYSREVANQRLSQNNGIIASFSRALTEGVSARQSNEKFNSVLDDTIESIYLSSKT